MAFLIITAVGLGLWSLRLMHLAFKLREASLIFAGTLVALSAVGVVTVYMLMDGCLGYIGHSPEQLAEPLPTMVLIQPEEERVVSQPIIYD